MKHRTSTSRLFHHLPKQTVLVVTDHINYTILLVRDQHCAEQAFLRKKGLFEQISKRELLLCLYNMLHARGHFLMETIDFANTNTISFDDFKEHFYTTVDEIIHISDGYISKMVNSRNRINEKIIFLHVSNTEEICDLMHSFLD